jgi:hypothetical protein
MSKKGVRVVVGGKQRARIDVEAMTQIVIALGRELAKRAEKKRRAKSPGTEAEA